MSATARMRSCNLAHSGGSLCGATGLVFRFPGLITLPRPPAPPNNENRPHGSPAKQSGGAAIAFFHHGVWRVFLKPVEMGVNTPQTRMVVRVCLSRVCLKSTRVVPFFPRVGSFFPRVYFFGFSPFSPSLSLFSLEKERERETNRGECLIHGFQNCHFFQQHELLSFLGGDPWKTGKTCVVFGVVFRYESITCMLFPRFTPLPREKMRVTHGLGAFGIGLTLAYSILKAVNVAYHSPVSSKKGLIGFGDLDHRCDASRSFCTADHAASLSVPPFMVARWEAREGLPVRASGVRFANPSSHRPRLAMGAVVFVNHTAWRPTMAHTQPTSSFSPALEELLKGIHDDARIMSQAMTALFELLSGCDPDRQVTCGGILGLIEPVVGSMDTLVGDLQSARNLGAINE